MRNDALTQVMDQIEKHPADMMDAVQANRFLDSYVDRLRDGNSKVQIAALQGVGRVANILKVSRLSVLINGGTMTQSGIYSQSWTPRRLLPFYPPCAMPLLPQTPMSAPLV